MEQTNGPRFKRGEVVTFRGRPSIVTMVTPSGNVEVVSYADGSLVSADHSELVKHVGRIIAADEVAAIGRFQPDGPIGYRARNVPGSVLRFSRAAALSDVATYWLERDAVAVTR